MKDGQTIGQWLNWDFEANGNLEIRDKNDYRIYGEDSSGYWFKCKFDLNGDKFDLNGDVIYFEDSDGAVVDNRIPEIIEHKGHKYRLIPNQNPHP